MKNVLAVKILREMKSQFVNIVGIKRTAILDIMTLIKDHYQDKNLGGIKTSEGFNFVDNLSLYKDATRYAPTPYNKLKKMVEYLKPGPASGWKTRIQTEEYQMRFIAASSCRESTANPDF